MATLVAGRDFRRINFGHRVDKAAATLPATAYGALFTITGGRILVTALIGEVTTVCSATATNLKVTATPTTGTAVDVFTNVAVTSKEVGTLISGQTYGSALVASNAGAAPTHDPFVCPIGTLGITTSATNTGAAKWTLLWIPLDDAASVS